MGEIIYHVVDITAGYGSKIILKNLSLALEKGSCTIIVGANGCGKSTLFSVMAGIKKVKSGQLVFHQEAIGYVPQGDPLFSELTVRDNLMLWYGGKTAMQKALEGGAAEKLGLLEVLKKRVDTLSGGMKRRVCIACAMAGDPSVLIMDEPGAALDIACKEVLYAWMKEYQMAGGTILMSSHEKAEWEMGDKVYLLQDGKLRDWKF